MVHVLPKSEFRIWGLNREEYDGPLYDFGVGPLLLVCWY